MPGDLLSTPFAVRDCALITLTAGAKTQTLREFRASLQEVPATSIYHHFWGRLLRPQFDEPEYNNDFASWAYHSLHDKPLAERLSMIVPSNYVDLEELRQELIEVVEERLDEKESLPWGQAEQQFYFMKSQIVVFDTGLRFTSPHLLFPHLASLSTGSIYYHFIDACSRTPDRCDDFSTWLRALDARWIPLCEELNSLDPYFSSLKEIRQKLVAIFDRYCGEKT